jgi:hypothetical protein
MSGMILIGTSTVGKFLIAMGAGAIGSLVVGALGRRR